MSYGKLTHKQDIDRDQCPMEVAMSRVQLALNVNDIEEAVSFYTRLFGTEPAKRRPGYANFAIAEPPRLAETGLAAVDERDTTCCYARQDKFWVKGAPGGERWEIYTVLADSATFWGQDDARNWAAVETELDADAGVQAVQCCGDPQAADEGAAGGACCG